MNLRIFGWSYAVTVVSLVVAFLYGSWEALILCAILGVLEVSLSFDNAVVNATILERMSPFWQRIFLTIGIFIAVFGMRLIFPLVIVAVTAGLNPVESLTLALDSRGQPADQPGTYAYLLDQAYPQIAAFGGMFLFMLFLDWMFTDRDIKWLRPIEKVLARIGRIERISVVIAVLALVLLAQLLAEDPAIVLLAGALGLITYLAVQGLGQFFEQAGQAQLGEVEESADRNGSGPTQLAKATGRAGFFLFLYLEVLDAAFSFDGVIGAFAITPDPIIIALGLGLIGAMFVRSLTVYLVRQGTLADYVYLEHGAHWAIGALAVILLIGIGPFHVNEIVTGLIGVVFIGAALFASIRRNRRLAAQGIDTHKTADELAAEATAEAPAVTVSLQKGQKLSLAKRGGGALSVVRMGLGWDAVKKRGLFGSRSQSIDLDASALLFDTAGALVDAVWFRQLRSQDGSVQHTGDNLTGAGEGDDESVVVDLPRLPASVAQIVFTVNSFTGQDFSQIENAFCRLVDETTGEELARYELSGSGQHNAQIMAKVGRSGDGGWTMTAIGAIASGRTFQDLLPAVSGHL